MLRPIRSLYRMAGIFVGANFRGKSKKALKINFVVLNFVTATSPGVWHCCTSDDRYTRSHLLCY